MVRQNGTIKARKVLFYGNALKSCLDEQAGHCIGLLRTDFD
jgi:hypothetical protein